ncbi:MAG: hypothetical protein JWP88_2148 [Flaviaesturariibacter sp.]|nr:hypothetical protein [Flaviaesturariibacter sp.]
MSTKNTIENLLSGTGSANADIYRSVKNIEQHLLKELALKQKTIDEKKSELSMMHFLLEEKNQTVQQLKDAMQECQKNIEGNRQLINKLVNDQARLQQDIEWYKRTYEMRSLLGTLKEKLFRKKTPKSS